MFISQCPVKSATYRFSPPSACKRVLRPRAPRAAFPGTRRRWQPASSGEGTWEVGAGVAEGFPWLPLPTVCVCPQ